MRAFFFNSVAPPAPLMESKWIAYIVKAHNENIVYICYTLHSPYISLSNSLSFLLRSVRPSPTLAIRSLALHCVFTFHLTFIQCEWLILSAVNQSRSWIKLDIRTNSPHSLSLSLPPPKFCFYLFQRRELDRKHKYWYS